MCDFDKLFIYSGNASSPNSGHSNINYINDAAGLYKDKVLYQSVKDLAGMFTNGQKLHELLYAIIEQRVEADPITHLEEFISQNEHSRIVTFTAPGGKARIIAVADWVTQTALSAIHKTQFQLLQLIPADRTFDHKSGLDIYVDDADNYISVDLSAATDRLPRVLQAKIIAVMYKKLGMNGYEIAKHWLSSVDRSYTTKNSLLEKTAPTIRYEVGQGMGLFSSWSSMALMHHFIVHELCGVEQADYRLVGDDLLLRNSLEEYDKYKTIMEELGVSVNPSKTLVSTQAPHTLEFARNYIIYGQKIAPIPFGCIFSYIDKKTSEAEVFFNFLEAMDFINKERLLALLDIRDFKELHIIAYFLWKNKKTTFSELDNIVRVGKHLGIIITEEQLSHIRDICETEARKSTLRPQFSFYETLLSQCTMRRDQDLNLKSMIASSVGALEYTDPRVVDYCDNMYDRLRAAEAPCYLPGLGNPTTTKVERKLITDFIDYLFKTDKALKSFVYKATKSES